MAVKITIYLCSTLQSSIPRDLSPIRISLGQAESSNVYKACRHVKTLSMGSEDLGLHSASIHIPVKTADKNNSASNVIMEWFNFLYCKRRKQVLP